MKNRNCPNKDACWDYDASNCEGCALGEKFTRQARKIKNMKSELAEAERRAKVFELALALAAENHRCEGCPSKECDGSIRGTQKCRDTIALLCIVQAEREIEEENDDDR